MTLKPTLCSICQKIISRSGDMPRHMKTHLPDKMKFMHRCSYPGCNFQNLQKSNVDTHIRTHTAEKSQACPDCDFRTADPGSLTRHRKRFHAYVPKPRRARTRGGPSRTGQSDSPESSTRPVSPTSTENSYSPQPDLHYRSSYLPPYPSRPLRSHVRGGSVMSDGYQSDTSAVSMQSAESASRLPSSESYMRSRIAQPIAQFRLIRTATNPSPEPSLEPSESMA